MRRYLYGALCTFDIVIVNSYAYLILQKKKKK